MLALVLVDTLGQQYRTPLILSEGDHGIFVASGTAIAFLALTALTIGWQIWSSARRRK